MFCQQRSNSMRATQRASGGAANLGGHPLDLQGHTVDIKPAALHAVKRNYNQRIPKMLVMIADMKSLTEVPWCFHQ